MDKFRIHGPSRLQGTVHASGAKNAALPALAAGLLFDQPLELHRLPRVRDLRTMLQLLDCLGVAHEEIEGDPASGADALSVRLLPGHDLGPVEAPYDLVKTMRASVLALGPGVARRGSARVSLPGGCAIGVRPIDDHLRGLEALGADVELEHGYVTAKATRLRGAGFRFNYPSVTGTENVLMAATLAQGTSVLDNCAREPEIVDLAQLLNAAGARIEGAGEERIVVEGVDSLDATTHTVIVDRIEAGTYLIGAAISRGDVTVLGAQPKHLEPLLEKLSEAGCDIDAKPDQIRVLSAERPRARDVITSPHPGFPTDLQAQYVALMTQAEGQCTVCETVFENRFQHVPELARMGAEIEVVGNRASIHGPSKLSGANVMATDLRASACLVLAGLVAEGETIVDRIYHLDRGYQKMESKLHSLGARVERIR
ncbi:MAG: UDP-N-acetylglucosamine 1-carboxyvinyltransferase [Acidobacteriota bacterium]